MKKLVNGIGMCLMGVAIALYLHEMVTGGGYILIVRGKLMAVYGMGALKAHAFAAAIVLVAPLIACAGCLRPKKEAGGPPRMNARP